MLPEMKLYRAGSCQWLLMDTPDFITEAIKKGHEWNAPEASIMAIFTKDFENPIVIDAGANLGAFSVRAALTIDKQGGVVHSFEPQRIVYQQLCANIFVNRLDNVYAHNQALGSEPGTLSIPELDIKTSANTGNFTTDSSIRQQLPGMVYSEKFKEFEVPVVPLDKLSLPGDVKFIKADIEGQELEFFIGATDTIKRSGYPPILFEMWSHYEWFQEKGAETVSYLESLGYQITKYALDEYCAQHPDHPREVSFTRTGESTFTYQQTR